MNAIKQTYCKPQIERIELDNEISLILVSGDPGDPYASILNEFIESKDPFKTIQS